MKILPLYMFFAMLITVIILHFTVPEPKVIIKHPSVEEEMSDVYVDDDDVCYRYHRKEVN
jgi:hypothetical protein